MENAKFAARFYATKLMGSGAFRPFFRELVEVPAILLNTLRDTATGTLLRSNLECVHFKFRKL